MAAGQSTQNGGGALSDKSQLALPLLSSCSARSDEDKPPSSGMQSAAALSELMDLVGGWGRMQRRAALAAMLVEANFVTLIVTAVLLLPRLRGLWHMSLSDEALASTSFFAGTLVGQFVIGAVSDRLGRRNALVIALPCAYIATLGMFACDGVFCLAAARSAGGFFAGGALITGYVMYYELTPKRDHFFARMLMVLGGWLTASLYVVAVAYALQDVHWRWTVLAAMLPSPLALLLLPHESPQFLAARGAHAQAVRVLQHIAHTNGVVVSTADLSAALRPPEHAPAAIQSRDGASSVESPTSGASPLVVPADVRTDAGRDHGAGDVGAGGVGSCAGVGVGAGARTKLLHLVRLCLVSAAWLGSVCTYYGILLWPIKLGSELYLRTAMGLVLEAPVYLLMPLAPRLCGSALSAWGVVLAWTALSWMAVAAIGVEGAAGATVLMQARFSATATSTIPYVAASLSFETPVRSSGVGFSASVGRLGSVVAPLLVSLVGSNTERALILAVLSASSALCVAALHQLAPKEPPLARL